MHCFYHPAVAAVGICKNCHRGLCPECGAEVRNGLACRARCEAEAEALDRLVQRNKTAYAKAGSLHARSAVVLALMGGVMMLWGLLMLSTGAGPFFLSVGLVMLVGAALQYRNGRRYAREATDVAA